MGKREIREQVFKLLFQVEFREIEEMEEMSKLYFDIYSETIDEEDVVVQRKFESSLDAFKYIFNSQMEPEDANEATKILMSYYNYGNYE